MNVTRRSRAVLIDIALLTATAEPPLLAASIASSIASLVRCKPSTLPFGLPRLSPWFLAMVCASFMASRIAGVCMSLVTSPFSAADMVLMSMGVANALPYCSFAVPLRMASAKSRAPPSPDRSRNVATRAALFSASRATNLLAISGSRLRTESCNRAAPAAPSGRAICSAIVGTAPVTVLLPVTLARSPA